jgi:hypothetical protein
LLRAPAFHATRLGARISASSMDGPAVVNGVARLIHDRPITTDL